MWRTEGTWPTIARGCADEGNLGAHGRARRGDLGVTGRDWREALAGGPISGASKGRHGWCGEWLVRGVHWKTANDARKCSRVSRSLGAGWVRPVPLPSWSVWSGEDDGTPSFA